MTALYHNITPPRDGGLLAISLPFIRAPAMVAIRPFIQFEITRKPFYLVGWHCISDGSITHGEHYLEEVRVYADSPDGCQRAHARFAVLVGKYLHDLHVCDQRMVQFPNDSGAPYGIVPCDEHKLRYWLAVLTGKFAAEVIHNDFEPYDD